LAVDPFWLTFKFKFNIMSGIDHYAFGKIIGEGTYAKVKLCKHIPTGINVAIKILNKRQMNESDDDLTTMV
jgi:serine/threonine protein kinase